MKSTLLFMLLLSLDSFAQHGTVASGNDLNGSGGTVSYSIGQIAYEYQEGSNGTVNQGIQQPYELFTVGIDDFPSILLEASIAPNPVVDALNLTIKHWMDGLHYTLYDDQGKIISSAEIKETITHIEMKILPPAAYFLGVTQNDQKLKTFKIIKH
jgi:opacity protein-like surface antigen